MQKYRDFALYMYDLRNIVQLVKRGLWACAKGSEFPRLICPTHTMDV